MKIYADYSSGSLVIRISGELDHHSARTAMRTIDDFIDEYLPRDTILDMSGLTFMDSSGIALILKVERRMRETGGRAFIQDPAKQPLRVIDASGIDRMIPIKGERK
ncbi:MAG: STAS domain-containing protein [Clostridia bacterium]|nr:STAS domain-containing protein [Clostridia bacterium]